VLHEEERQCYVLKQIEMKDREDAADQELKILKMITHPYLVQFKESFVRSYQSKNYLCIVMIQAAGGDLEHYLQSCVKLKPGQCIPESQILDWFVQLCYAIQALHSTLILHRDIKAENIFLDASFERVVLGDFSISTILKHSEEKVTERIGTPYYLSPEICRGKEYSFSSDLWALGCVLYKMCTFTYPFDATSVQALVNVICKSEPKPIDPLRGYSANLRFLCQLLLSKDPLSRPSIESILKMPFLQDYVRKWNPETLKSTDTTTKNGKDSEQEKSCLSKFGSWCYCPCSVRSVKPDEERFLSF